MVGAWYMGARMGLFAAVFAFLGLLGGVGWVRCGGGFGCEVVLVEVLPPQGKAAHAEGDCRFASQNSARPLRPGPARGPIRQRRMHSAEALRLSG